ncbi:MAG: M20/M25/M40 family metallo-hydrolase [Myxococcota bacterium]
MLPCSRILALTGSFLCATAASCAPAQAPARTEAHPTAPQTLAAPVSSAPMVTATGEPSKLEPELAPDVLPYRETAAAILRASLASDDAYQKLAQLCDDIGPRLSGSLGLERGVAWARQTFEAEGHENVALEPVQVPHWVRGLESAELLVMPRRKLHVLTLGGSVPTPPAGLTAELMVVHSFDELEARKQDVRGKIVLFDHPMRREGNPALNYGAALPYRSTAAMRAAPFGAVAVLTRSLTANSLGAAHTGSMRYAPEPARKIPAAALPVEEAELLSRLAQRHAGLKIKLTLLPQTLPDAQSANVVAELRGREKPEEVVLIGAHLDSWDVGQGAQDNGAGVVTVMQALTTLRKLGLRPRRTLRAVLFTNEENGVRGGKTYAETHREELAHHEAAFEIDLGAGAPLGFMTDGEPNYLPQVSEIARLLTPFGASSVFPGYPGEDVLMLKAASVPLFGMWLDVSHYFDVHHSAADTLDKVNPENLKKNVAALATQAFVIADRERSLRAPLASGAAP